MSSWCKTCLFAFVSLPAPPHPENISSWRARSLFCSWPCPQYLDYIVCCIEGTQTLFLQWMNFAFEVLSAVPTPSWCAVNCYSSPRRAEWNDREVEKGCSRGSEQWWCSGEQQCLVEQELGLAGLMGIGKVWPRLPRLSSFSTLHLRGTVPPSPDAEPLLN